VDSIPKNADGQYEYSEVVNVDSFFASKLYSNAKLFIVEAFKSGKDVTQLNDDNTKTVVGNGADPIVLKGLAGSAIDKYLKFRINIQSKDNKYKYTINNLQLSFNGTMVHATATLDDEKKLLHYVTKKQYKELIEVVESDMSDLVTSLKSHMSSKSADW
ncbi:MAG: DUF4468 domain-containing protein, partial [Bacteroidetes bacterium]|nr:DUF4468 domain-containing protein [Bacteroidota bacterium]